MGVKGGCEARGGCACCVWVLGLCVGMKVRGGNDEVVEGAVEGADEGAVDGAVERVVEGVVEDVVEGVVEGRRVKARVEGEPVNAGLRGGAKARCAPSAVHKPLRGKHSKCGAPQGVWSRCPPEGRVGWTWRGVAGG